MKKLLVTGGAGFIGSNFIRWILRARQDLEVVNLDKLTYAGNLENLKELKGDPRCRFVRGDVADPRTVAEALAGCQEVVHFAAETHVDRSIVGAEDFLRTNVLGTHTLLEAARQARVARFIHISTDEVYGSLPDGEAQEGDPLFPNSPYSASKAASDHLVRSYFVTHGLPVVVVRGSNNYGPHQFPEKFIPLLTTQALEGKPLPIYGDGQYIREWLWVEDFCEAIELVGRKGAPGEIYNVGSGQRWVNLEVARLILRFLDKPESLLRRVQDRPGHDRRYAISSEKVKGLGWRPRHRFEEGLQALIRWYQANEDWWRPLKDRSLPVSRNTQEVKR
ncbi:MAG: dTDP-glucose 4,6-dehydratase [Candidatus Omnitrophica bacterium]|nr:dTDP-glucose 4,6-dehydratase [Candidatus Omnitrophota bacterium]